MAGGTRYKINATAEAEEALRKKMAARILGAVPTLLRDREEESAGAGGQFATGKSNLAGALALPKTGRDTYEKALEAP